MWRSEEPKNEIGERQKEEDKLDSEFGSIKKVLEKKELKFKVKTSKDGRMFGTIISKQISDEIKKLGYNIDKKTIVMDHVIDTLGTHKVVANVHKRVSITITVVVC